MLPHFVQGQVNEDQYPFAEISVLFPVGWNLSDDWISQYIRHLNLYMEHILRCLSYNVTLCL